MEEEFNSLNLGITWSVFGNADRSDIDDLLQAQDIHGPKRLTIVDLWKRHPNHPTRRRQGFEVENVGFLDKIMRFLATSISASARKYYRVTGTIKDARRTECFRSTIYQCAQDHMAFYCEHGETQTIFYDGLSRDMSINLLFEHKYNGCLFQNALFDFQTMHPTFAHKVLIEETVEEVFLSHQPRRVLHAHYAAAIDNDSQALTLADVGCVLAFNEGLESDDPVKALQSLEDLVALPVPKFHWCHLVSRQEAKGNPNNCIWGSWLLYPHFDALKTEVSGAPLVAVKYMNTAEQAEDILVGDKVFTRRRVDVAIEFFDNGAGRKVAMRFQGNAKTGTTLIDDLHYSSFVYPEDPDQFQGFLEESYTKTMMLWAKMKNIRRENI